MSMWSPLLRRMVESSIPPQRSAGIGIDGAHLELLLQPFKQVDSSMSQGNDGIGLGLSTARQLVELMQGVIGDSRRKDLVRSSAWRSILPLRNLHRGAVEPPALRMWNPVMMVGDTGGACP